MRAWPQQHAPADGLSLFSFYFFAFLFWTVCAHPPGALSGSSMSLRVHVFRSSSCWVMAAVSASGICDACAVRRSTRLFTLATWIFSVSDNRRQHELWLRRVFENWDAKRNFVIFNLKINMSCTLWVKIRRTIIWNLMTSLVKINS